MAWQDMTVKLTGIAPLLMHSGSLADPSNPAAKVLAGVSSKRRKSDADYAEIERLEWFGSLYRNANGQIVVPAALLNGALLEGARHNKVGTRVAAWAYAKDDAILTNLTPQELSEKPEYRLKVVVRIGRRRVWRTRPRFDPWVIEATFAFEPEHLDVRTLFTTLTRIGREVGIGDGRPQFGRFSVSAVTNEGLGPNTSLDSHATLAHAAMLIPDPVSGRP